MLAALTPDKGRGIGPLDSNMRMMAALCAACEAVPPAHLVYISSDAVYPMKDGLVSEATPAEPTDLYAARSEEHTSELQSLMRISYAVFCLKKKKKISTAQDNPNLRHQRTNSKD